MQYAVDIKDTARVKVLESIAKEKMSGRLLPHGTTTVLYEIPKNSLTNQQIDWHVNNARKMLEKESFKLEY